MTYTSSRTDDVPAEVDAQFRHHLAQLTEERSENIEILKQARKQLIVLRTLIQRYDTSLAAEFGSPARKLDERLGAMLLQREIES